LIQAQSAAAPQVLRAYIVDLVMAAHVLAAADTSPEVQFKLGFLGIEMSWA
jgi:hypothetical protein